ncbi:MAG: hypothetical protein HQ495_05470 [Alphaproteobacteria bacterium]|nr:hypothetical protein [Alphaproteobacteria bacterium]
MSEQKRFEVVIYNRIVRDLVERNENHKDLKDDWADNHYQEIRATTADGARRKVEIRYPGAKGFVVASVTEVQAFDDDD